MKTFLTIALTLVLATPGAALTCRDFPGATYTEAQPNGAVVALHPGSHVELNGERIEFASPGLDPLYTRLSPSGTRFAGQGHNDGQAWEYVAGLGWRVLGPTCGVSPLAYRPDDSLLISSQCEVGSQGYRYVDASGRPWTGDETYGDVLRGIYEYTTCNGITIGQGAFGGVKAIDRDGRAYLLEPGDTRFVRFNCAGSMLAVSVVKFSESKSRACWLTEGELRTFPAYPSASQTDPEPDPEPEPEPQYQRRSPDYSEQVAEVARRFPIEWEAAREDEGKPRTDAFIRRLAWELHQIDPNVGLNGKRGGDTISFDALAYRNETAPGGAEVIDVIGGSGHTPQWRDVTLPDVLGRFIQPTDPGPATDPDPKPSGLEARVAELERRVLEMRQVISHYERQIGLINLAIDALEQGANGVPEARVQELIDAAVAKLRIVGRSQAAGWGPFSHTHESGGYVIEFVR